MQSKIRSFTKLTILLLFILISIFLSLQTVEASKGESSYELNKQLREIIEDIVNWKKKTNNLKLNESLFNDEFLQNAGDTSVDWYPLGLGRVGYDEAYDTYLAAIQKNVRQRYKDPNKLSKARATEWHRISLAILASGGNPREVAIDDKGNPIDLIADGTFNRGITRTLGAQGLNGWIWGLITMDSLRYKVPEDAHDDRKDIIKHILREELEDGGFSLMLSDEMEIDMTAMALQALAPYYNSEETFTYTQKAIDKEVTKTVRQVVDRALDALSMKQEDNGGFSLGKTPNVESTVQVLVALTSLGINPLTDERFVKGGNTLLDAILAYRRDDGGFAHTYHSDSSNPYTKAKDSNSLATEQVLYGLVALIRHLEGYRTLYDFREEFDPKMKEKIETLVDAIDYLPENIKEEDRKKVETLFKEYKKIPVSERMYISNYHRLAEAMESLKIKNDSEAMTEAIGEIENRKGTITPIMSLIPEEESIRFRKMDEEQVKMLPEKMTLEYERVVNKLYDRLKDSNNKSSYKPYEKVLEEKKKAIEQIRTEIDELNKDIMNQLYPFEQIKLKDRKEVEKIIERFESFSEYDQSQVKNIDKVIEAQTILVKKQKLIYLSIFLLSLSLIIILIVLFKRSKQSSRHNRRK